MSCLSGLSCCTGEGRTHWAGARLAGMTEQVQGQSGHPAEL